MKIGQGKKGSQEGYEITGPFTVYGTQQELLRFATQLRHGALKVDPGIVDIDTTLDTPVESVKPWKDK